MSYCLNPYCQSPINSDVDFCNSCGSELVLMGQYRAIRPIGQGGFGRTFLAIDIKQATKSRCVIKQFAPQNKGNLEQAAELFRQEALRLAELGKHDQIPTLLAYYEQGGYQYLVQEFIDGQNLAQELANREPYSQAEVEQILRSLLDVLNFVHNHGVVHRDIKPENIIRRQKDGKLILVDFGSAKQITGTALLKTGTSIGSAEYVSPEQARGKATFASDIYSLGVTCIHLLTQVSPFDLIDANNAWVWRDFLNTNKVNDNLGRFLDKLIAPAPNQRFQSVSEAIASLNNLQETSEATLPINLSSLQNRTSSKQRWLFPALALTAIVVGFTVLVEYKESGRDAYSRRDVQIQSAPYSTENSNITTSDSLGKTEIIQMSDAKAVMAAMNRGQISYFNYAHRHKFSFNLRDLELDTKKLNLDSDQDTKSSQYKTANYIYQVISQSTTPYFDKFNDGNYPLVVMGAEPQQKNFKTYVGMVWAAALPSGVTDVTTPSKPIVLRSVRTFAILCESDEPYQRLPEMSDSFLFNNIDNASCPAGFSKVRDW